MVAVTVSAAPLHRNSSPARYGRSRDIVDSFLRHNMAEILVGLWPEGEGLATALHSTGSVMAVNFAHPTFTFRSCKGTTKPTSSPVAYTGVSTYLRCRMENVSCPCGSVGCPSAYGPTTACIQREDICTETAVQQYDPKH